MQNALLIACGFMLLGVVLRARLRWLAAIYVPASLVAGLVALILTQTILITNSGDAEPAARVFQQLCTLFIRATIEWDAWRSPLIPVIFAGMLLVVPERESTGQLRATVQQGIAAWVLILGQLAIGLTVAWLILGPTFGVPIHFGQLLEVSWAGGFGSSAAWGNQHEKLNVFPGARDLAVFFTTTGLLYGVLSGVLLVNIAIRRRWTSQDSPIDPTDAVRNVETARPRPGLTGDAIDPLMFQILLLAAAFTVGVLIQKSVASISQLAPQGSIVRSLGTDLPLFVFTLVGGWLVRRFIVAIGGARMINNEWMHRLTGVALELLIFVAIATLKVGVIRENWLPSLILMLAGAAWVWFNVVWVSRRLLPRDCWFELAIMNHGFATATTAQGMMLLRMVDRDLRTNAARIYAQAAPLTAIFIGGGVITYLMPLILGAVNPIVPIGCAAGAAVVLFIVGKRVAANAPPCSSAAQALPTAG